MKKTRFFSLFLLLVLLVNLCCVPFASAEEKKVIPDPDILAKAALLVDADSGAVAYAKNEHQELYPASLTKIMTALLVFEAIDNGKLRLSQELTASETALANVASDGSTANIKVGESMSVENLLYCMLVVSANEACEILAEGVSGSIDAFVAAMNAKAKALGCKNTHFVNPNGLHDPDHYTSAWDLYLITKAALKYDRFMQICDTAEYTVPATNLSAERVLHTTNHLLSNWRVIGYRNKEAHGIKTGSTSDAGYCLVSSASRGNLSYLSVILGAERVVENNVGNIRSFSETTRMFDYGFENFSYRNILEKKEIIREVPVTLSKIDHVTVHPAESVEVLLRKDIDPDEIERIIKVEESVEAPVATGQKLGTLTLKYGNTTYATVDLLALNSVEPSRYQVMLHKVELFFQRTEVRIAIIAVIVLVVLLLIWLLFFRRRRRYGGRRRGRRGGYRGGRRF